MRMQGHKLVRYYGLREHQQQRRAMGETERTFQLRPSRILQRPLKAAPLGPALELRDLCFAKSQGPRLVSP